MQHKNKRQPYFNRGRAILLRHQNFLKYLESGTDRQPMTFWLLGYIYSSFHASFDKVSPFFEVTMRILLGHPKTAQKSGNFEYSQFFCCCCLNFICHKINVVWYMIIIWFKSPHNGNYMMTSYYDVTMKL